MDAQSQTIPARPPRLVTLVLMSSMAPLAMNIFVPSLPAMARHFQVDYSVAQLLVSLYLAAIAVVQLFIGPASDRFGRRPVVLTCFGLFCGATLAALYAADFYTLLAWRIVQCFSAAGIVLARAIVRDTVATEDAAGKIGYITMGMSVTPMIAPFIGGYLDEHFGWQASFWVTLACGLVVLAIAWWDLGETNLAPSSSMSAQFRSYPELLTSPRFWGYAATATFASGVFFAFLGGGPYVSTEMLHMTPSQYGLYFGIISFGYMSGNFLSGRYSRRWGMNRMMMIGNIISLVAMAVSLFLFTMGLMHPLTLFVPAAFVGVGNGMTLPSANAGIVSVRPHLAGSASGLGGAMAMGGGAALAALASSLLSPQSGPFPLVVVCLISASAAVAATMIVVRRANQVGGLP